MKAPGCAMRSAIHMKLRFRSFAAFAGGRAPLQASCSAPALVAAALFLPAGAGWWYWRQQPSALPMPKALEAGGTVVHQAVRKQITAAGAGLVVVGEVGQNECLLRVPKSAIVSGKLAQSLLEAPSLPPDVALCALLAEARRCAERGNDLVGLQTYLLALPQKFHDLPWMLKDEEVPVVLRGTALHPCLHVLGTNEEENRQVVLKTLGDRLEAPWSLERWRWARATVMTRAGVHGLDEDGNIGIVPLVDFANCASDPTAECRLNDEFIELVSLRPLKAGDEITISYGQQSQEQQLFTFGFFLDTATEEIMTPLAMTAEGHGEDTKLRQVLLRLLFLERAEGAAMQDMPPYAMLRREVSGHLDLSELIATAQLHEMSQQELGEVAAAVKATSRLKLPAPSPAALKRLKALLQEWHAELEATDPGEGQRGRGQLRHAFLRRYRQNCATLVADALKQIEAQELASSIGSPLSL